MCLNARLAVKTDFTCLPGPMHRCGCRAGIQGGGAVVRPQRRRHNHHLVLVWHADGRDGGRGAGGGGLPGRATGGEGGAPVHGLVVASHGIQHWWRAATSYVPANSVLRCSCLCTGMDTLCVVLPSTCPGTLCVVVPTPRRRTGCSRWSGGTQRSGPTAAGGWAAPRGRAGWAAPAVRWWT